MEEPVNPNPLLPEEGRPRLLTIVCILTFIGSGLNLVSNLFIFIFFDAFKVVAETMSKTLNMPGIDLIIQGPATFFAVSAGIYTGSLAGALMMWRLRKTGFHVYTIAQILLVAAPMYFFKLPGPGIVDILLAVTFIFLYSRNLKAMS